jgi:aminoglycoside phosphotransferase (APT) family kinase protein
MTRSLTFRRSAGPAVHALLVHLERVAFPYSPRLLGVDARGREVLRYVPGASGRHGWAHVVPDRGLQAFARLLRTYHDSVADFVAPVHDWALQARPKRPGELICHGDFGPWNLVWNAGEPVGLLDFDFAGPASPLTDVAHALQYSVPFRDDDECLRRLAYPSPPNRRARLETFADAYGLFETAGLVERVIAGQRDEIEQVRRLAAAGRQPHARWVAVSVQSSGFITRIVVWCGELWGCGAGGG